jgi:hypothetical protein
MTSAHLPERIVAATFKRKDQAADAPGIRSRHRAVQGGRGVVALQAEADGVVTTSMRGSLSGPRSGGGADCINADGVTWAAKNSRDIRSILKATNG